MPSVIASVARWLGEPPGGGATGCGPTGGVNGAPACGCGVCHAGGACDGGGVVGAELLPGNDWVLPQYGQKFEPSAISRWQWTHFTSAVLAQEEPSAPQREFGR